MGTVVRLACCLVLVTTTGACHGQDDYLLGPSQADQVLKVTLSATTLPADGISRATITAELDPETDADKRNVTFTTTAGTLVAAGKEGSSLVVQADTFGKAVVELRSTTTAATAQLEVTVASVTRTASVTFQAIAREAIFDVTLSAASIPADSFSTTTITATLKRLGTPSQRAIRFETSLGVFISSGQPTARIATITADATGRAVVELQSDGTVGTARVRVIALDASYEFEVPFEKVLAEDVIDIVVSRTSIPADGFSTTAITATLKRIGTPQQRAIKFETSAGTLIAAGLASGRAVTVTADGVGKAVVELQSDKTVGTARVRVTAFEVPSEFPISFTPPDPSQIITVSTDPSSVPADGAMSILVTARVNANLPAGRRGVVFRSTLGLFVPATIVEADGSNLARATLVSTTTGSARITAIVDGVTAETTAQFTTAWPDRLVVAPDAVQLRSGGSTTIRVTLIRSSGSVSPRLEVAYSATTSTGNSLGSFSRVTLAESGTSTAMFNVDTTGYVGPVTIRATVNGTSGTATINITR